MSDLTDLYQSVILDHNKRPRNRGKPPTANRTATGDNPSCGDNCTVYLHLDAADRIDAIGFEGSGCAISQAATSLMTTQVKGKTAAEAQVLFDEFKHIVTTGQAPEESATSPPSPESTPSPPASSAPPSAGTPPSKPSNNRLPPKKLRHSAASAAPPLNRRGHWPSPLPENRPVGRFH
jgi:nitrogen fixation protein NifU and related proteins